MSTSAAVLLCAAAILHLLLPGAVNCNQQQLQPPSRERFILRFLGENSVLGPGQILTGIDWRFRKLRSGEGRYRNSSYVYTELRFLGTILTIKCTNFTEGAPLLQHCPGLHYLVKRVIIRIAFITVGFLAAALGTCDMTFSKKFQKQHSTVLRQIPLSRRNTVMSGFDLLRNQTQVRIANCSSMLLYDVKDTGQREDMMKQEAEK